MGVVIWLAVIVAVVLAFFFFRNVIAGFWQDGGRGQFLVMGMPAVIFLVLGVTALGLASAKLESLDDSYERRVQKANERSREIREEIIKQQQLENVTAPNVQAVIPADKKSELEKAQSEEKIFLEKLISLDNSNDEYKFQLAMLAKDKGELQKALNLLQIIAPRDEPGYAKAHLTLAMHYLVESQRARSAQLKKELMKAAEDQIDNCLIADEASVDAKEIKAHIHTQNGQQLKAYEIYQELFEEDPKYYRQLLDLATALGRNSDLKSFLDQASSRFRQKCKQSDDNVAEWTDSWINYVECMKRKRDLRAYDSAENAVRGEMQKYDDPTDIGKRVFLQRQLSRIYSDKAISRGRNQPLGTQKEQLSDLAKAIENDPKNMAALQWLTILGTNPELRAEVEKIYNPKYDPNVPWIVLSELGHDALRREAHSEAITFFEQSRKKNPRNPEVLNNLAYSYLEAGQNPEQALLLVDQAISNLSKRDLKGRNVAGVIASFYDTRGVALMQLERYEEATAAFEVAFKNRPKDQEILVNLVNCYDKRGLERQAETLRRRLDTLKKEEIASPQN